MTSGERRKSNKLDPLEFGTCNEVAEEVKDMPPMPRLKATLPDQGDPMFQRIEILESELSLLRKRQDVLEQKHQDVEAVRRGQLDCLSERIYEAEKMQRQVQERTDDAIEKARAAFQKTASDMEHERINLMSVITQVNQNFEHLSREMAGVSDIVGRTQQDLIHLQQDVAERSEIDVTTFAHQLAHLEEHYSNHLRELQQSQVSFSQQLMDVHQFRTEVSSYLEQLTQMLHDSEARSEASCRGRLNEHWLNLRKEVSRKISQEVARHVGSGSGGGMAKDDELNQRSLREVDDYGVTAVRSCERTDQAARRAEISRHPVGRQQPTTRTASAERHEMKGRPPVAFPQVKDPDEGQDYRLLEFLLTQDDRLAQEPLRWPVGELPS